MLPESTGDEIDKVCVQREMCSFYIEQERTKSERKTLHTQIPISSRPVLSGSGVIVGYRTTRACRFNAQCQPPFTNERYISLSSLVRYYSLPPHSY